MGGSGGRFGDRRLWGGAVQEGLTGVDASAKEAPPAGLAELPPTRALFETMWQVDRDWMPGIRDLCRKAEADGTKVSRLQSLEEIDAFTRA